MAAERRESERERTVHSLTLTHRWTDAGVRERREGETERAREKEGSFGEERMMGDGIRESRSRVGERERQQATTPRNVVVVVMR